MFSIVSDVNNEQTQNETEVDYDDEEGYRSSDNEYRGKTHLLIVVSSGNQNIFHYLISII